MIEALWVALALFAQEAEPVSQPTLVQHENPHFRLSIPPGYAPLPNPPAGILHGYQRTVGKEDHPVVVTLEILDGKLDRQRVANDDRGLAAARAKLPPGTDVKVGTCRWAGFDLDVIETHTPRLNTEYLGLAAQIPLIPRALQITVVGPAALEQEMRKDLEAILSTTRGQTNWLTDSQRTLAWWSGVPNLLAWGLIVFYGLAHLAAFRGKPRRLWRLRMGWLAVSTVLFAFNYVTDVLYRMSQAPEASKFAILGMAGLCLYLADKVRRDAKASEAISPTPAPPAANQAPNL